MSDTTDELSSAIDLAVGRAVLAACALALLITTFVPMTRWMGEWVDDNGPLQEDVVPPVRLHNLWDLGAAGDTAGHLVGLPLVLLALMCAVAVVDDRRARLAAAVGGVVVLWVGLFVLAGFEGEATSGRWLCLLVPLVTVAAAAWTAVAHRRLYG